jgi:hypothetical protein
MFVRALINDIEGKRGILIAKQLNLSSITVRPPALYLNIGVRID